MRALPRTFILVFAIASAAAGAHSFGSEQTAIEFDQRGASQRDFYLINDGNFEDGTCWEGDGAWTCDSDLDCDWILDLVPIGLWNYDGIHAAWLGGTCYGDYVSYTRICQEILIDGDALSWYSMAFNYSYGPNAFSVSLDGEVVCEIPPDDFGGLDYDRFTADVGGFMGGAHELCFNFEGSELDPPPMCFIDFVELNRSTGLPGDDDEALSLSMVKSLY